MKDFLNKLEAELAELRVYLERHRTIKTTTIDLLTALDQLGAIEELVKGAHREFAHDGPGSRPQPNTTPAAPTDDPEWEALEDIREIEAGLRGHFPEVVERMIHIQKVMSTPSTKESPWLVGQAAGVCEKLLKSIVDEERLPDSHSAKEWARKRLTKFA